MRSAPHSFAPRDLLPDRIHEQAHARPPALVAGDHLRHARGFAGVGQIPAVIRRELRVAVGHQRRLVRAGGLDEVVEPRIAVVARPGGGVALDVELDIRMVGGKHLGERVHVGGSDVALVGARMHGDALRAGGDDGSCGVQDARPATLAGIAQPRDLVEVDGESGHERLCEILDGEAVSVGFQSGHGGYRWGVVEPRPEYHAHAVAPRGVIGQDVEHIAPAAGHPPATFAGRRSSPRASARECGIPIELKRAPLRMSGDGFTSAWAIGGKVWKTRRISIRPDSGRTRYGMT